MRERVGSGWQPCLAAAGDMIQLLIAFVLAWFSLMHGIKHFHNETSLSLITLA